LRNPLPQDLFLEVEPLVYRKRKLLRVDSTSSLSSLRSISNLLRLKPRVTLVSQRSLHTIH
jgi:hypothetical protein